MSSMGVMDENEVRMCRRRRAVNSRGRTREQLEEAGRGVEPAQARERQRHDVRRSGGGTPARGACEELKLAAAQLLLVTQLRRRWAGGRATSRACRPAHCGRSTPWRRMDQRAGAAAVPSSSPTRGLRAPPPASRPALHNARGVCHSPGGGGLLWTAGLPRALERGLDTCKVLSLPPCRFCR